MNTTPSNSDDLTIEPTPSAEPTQPVWGTPADQEPTTAASSGQSGSGSEPGPSYPGAYSGTNPGAYSGTNPGTYQGGPVAPPTRPTPGDGFFEAVRRLGVVRPDSGRMVGGVCAGLADKWGVSPVAVRVLFVLVGLFFGAGLFIYGLLWMLLPHPDGRIHAQQLLRGTITAGFVGALLAILVGGPAGAAADGGPGWFPVLVIGAVVAYLVYRRRRPTNV